MINTIDLTEKRVFRNRPQIHLLDDLPHTTINITKGSDIRLKRRVPWKQYESLYDLISANCRRSNHSNNGNLSTNSMYFISPNGEATIISGFRDRLNTMVSHQLNISRNTSASTIDFWEIVDDEMGMMSTTFNENEPPEYQFMRDSGYFLVTHRENQSNRKTYYHFIENDYLPHPFNKPSIQMKLREIDLSYKKETKLWKSQKSKFKNPNKDFPWSKKKSDRMKSDIRELLFRHVPIYRYPTILDGMEEASEMDENGWISTRRSIVPWSNYEKRKKNPLNTFNLPEEFYDNYDDTITMPEDRFFLNTNNSNIINLASL